LGAVEGVAESAAALLKVVSSRLTDRTGRRKPFVVAGYGLSGVAKPLIGAAAAWPWVLAWATAPTLSCCCVSPISVWRQGRPVPPACVGEPRRSR